MRRGYMICWYRRNTCVRRHVNHCLLWRLERRHCITYWWYTQIMLESLHLRLKQRQRRQPITWYTWKWGPQLFFEDTGSLDSNDVTLSLTCNLSAGDSLDVTMSRSCDILERNPSDDTDNTDIFNVALSSQYSIIWWTYVVTTIFLHRR